MRKVTRDLIHTVGFGGVMVIAIACCIGLFVKIIRVIAGF